MSDFDTQHDAAHAGTPLTAPIEESRAKGLPEAPTVSDAALQEHARHQRTAWQPAPIGQHQDSLELRLDSLQERLMVCLQSYKHRITSRELTPALELLESSRLLESVLQELGSTRQQFLRLPHVYVDGTSFRIPRILSLAEQYLVAAKGIWSPDSLSVYIAEIQQKDILVLGEVLLLPGSLKLAQAEFILDRAEEALELSELPDIEHSPFSGILHSLRRLSQFEWQDLLESFVVFHHVLARDPAGVFLKMEPENRNAYRLRVAQLAARADLDELQTAYAALHLANIAAQNPPSDPRLAWRTAHVGYYLFDEGTPALEHRIGHHPTVGQQIRGWVMENRSEVYILSIFILSLLIIAALMTPLVQHRDFWPVVVTLFLALLPATQGASDLINGTVSSLLTPRTLPKLDFSRGIPEDQTTFVVVPTLLLNERQVEDLFEELEARYLSNQDPHLHFGVLTDLPDSNTRPDPEDRNHLVELAVRITGELNAKYASERAGGFLLLHRHRTFNARQGVWMGWERKRGKLLDLNQLLAGEYDSFPVKAGPVEVLKHVRYIITLDSDTQLPRSTAARMIGCMAHPLNQAIIHPRSRIVTAGYGILQPRVGVSVASASRSRFAALYSGETGYDIYTRAISDVYQDLFGEGIFTGKGIYEVSILHQVLTHRFPKNHLLSHDLIEGAYARAGLVTDIEVIDDYPSHYSAHNRRKHRWLRGDWQITQWLFSKVPDEFNRRVANPISAVSKWKIFDNLRRSLIEPITMILLVLGWFVLPGGALYWTLVTLLLLLLPSVVQLGFNLFRAAVNFSSAMVFDSLNTFVSSFGFSLLNIAFLPHQTMLSIDAVTRTLARRFVTGKRLLEWETAAQSEAGRTKTSLDLYLQLSPLIALCIGVPLYLLHHYAIFSAGPILFLWAVAPLLAGWLNSPPRKADGTLKQEDLTLLRETAYSTWRYFADFGGAENHWLIPDNVEEKDLHQVRKLSPTNLGMLFNARQAALELGFLTLPEFAHATRESLATYSRLEKSHGHIFNWYNIDDLQPVAPLTVSTVDSGNLAASLYALHGGSLDLLSAPLLSHASFLALSELLQRTHRIAPADALTATSLTDSIAWLFRLSPIEVHPDSSWADRETFARAQQLTAYIGDYLPWLLPQYAPLLSVIALPAPETLTFESAFACIDALLNAAQQANTDAAKELASRIPFAQKKFQELKADIEGIAADSARYAHDMRYDFLFVESRQLLSIGYDVPTDTVHSACYDLMASEARIAFFLAIAKGDIPQKAWFRLDRSHVLVDGNACLLSWTGTMFEYLMPTLWMRSFPQTLIARSLEACVAIQQKHVDRMPWGISESGFAKTDPQGRYSYQAWGIPAIALKYGAEDGPVISPYSSFLALPFAREAALANLRRMAKLNWAGDFGFYEAADYIDASKDPEYAGSPQPVLVRSWMAHHQGMSLLALTNLLADNAFQRWFHANARVRAAEILLHERPLAPQVLKDLKKRKPLESDEEDQ